MPYQIDIGVGQSDENPAYVDFIFVMKGVTTPLILDLYSHPSDVILRPELMLYAAGLLQSPLGFQVGLEGFSFTGWVHEPCNFTADQYAMFLSKNS